MQIRIYKISNDKYKANSRNNHYYILSVKCKKDKCKTGRKSQKYALLLDRASVSKLNGFVETDGTIRIYFTIEQAQKKLCRSRQCTTKIFRELEKSGLICHKKQGLGKPAVITLNYPESAKLIDPQNTV